MANVRMIMRDLDVMRQDLLSHQPNATKTDRSTTVNEFDQIKHQITVLLQTIRDEEKKSNPHADDHDLARHQRQDMLDQVKVLLHKMKLHIESESKSVNVDYMLLTEKKQLFKVFFDEMNQCIGHNSHTTVRNFHRVHSRALESTSDLQKRVQERKSRRDRRRQKNKSVTNNEAGPVDIEIADIRVQEQDHENSAGIPTEPQTILKFAQEVDRNRQQENDMLDGILIGMNELYDISSNLNRDINVSSQIIQQVDSKMDRAIVTTKTANIRMKEMIEQHGGVTRWCPLMLCTVILLALLGAIWTLYK